MSNILEAIFFFKDDGGGMSQDLFFTSSYFWVFFAWVLGSYSILLGNKIISSMYMLLSVSFMICLSIIHPPLWSLVVPWFLFASLISYYVLRKEKITARNVYLFAVSLFFYYKTSAFFFSILLFSTLLDYTIGMAIHSSHTEWKRKTLVTLSVVSNLCLLAYFKYSYFFVDAWNSAFDTQYHVVNYLAVAGNSVFRSEVFSVDKILLPVGISFYTFQTISYSVDIYRKQLTPVYNILDFGFFVSFFPQLVAGPIVRASEFIPQLYRPYRLRAYTFGLAVFWILNGLLKKGLADFIAKGFIDVVFDEPMRKTGFEIMMAILGYSFQVYADFSGYTDIAIGLALLMGFQLNTNFNSPYKAQNVTEFWKRWHISLSTWLRDYLYIPLGGKRNGSIASYLCILGMLGIVAILSKDKAVYVLGIGFSTGLVLAMLAWFIPTIRNAINTNINLLITMLLGGLWHGSKWTFVIWGGLNGLGLIVYKMWRKISPWEESKKWYAHAWKVLLTFLFISFTRIYFRSPNLETVEKLYYQIRNNFSTESMFTVIASLKIYYGMFILGMVIHWISEEHKISYRKLFIRLHPALKMSICILAGILFYQSQVGGTPPFIYFQF